MLEMKITIEAPALTEAINNLAISLKAEKSIMSKGEVVIPAGTPMEVTNASQTTAAPITAAPITAAPQIPQTPPVQQPVTQQTPVTPQQAPAAEKQITLEELSKAGAGLVEKGRIAQIMALIQNYGVPSINQLNPAQYTQFANDLRNLGANI